MKPLTVKELYEACADEINQGNADKVIMISQDDEGNGFHYLWYSFGEVEEEYVNTSIASVDDTIFLG